MSFLANPNTVRFNATAIGVANFLVASAYSGCTTPESSGVIDGKVYRYYAQSPDGTQWEYGSGAYSILTHTLSRTTISATSNSDQNVVNFTVIPVVDVYPSPSPTLEPPPTVLRNYIAGAILSAAGGTSTFGISAGMAADSTNVDYITLASAFTKTTAAWAPGSGNGALDTGSISPSTCYHVFLIERPDTDAADVVISLSATAPTTSYSLIRRIGSMITDVSSNWIKFSQYGDEFLWDVGRLDVNGFTGSTAIQTPVLTVPTGVKVWAILATYSIAGASLDSRYLVFPLDANSANALATTVQTMTGGTYFVASLQSSTSTFRCRTSTAAKVGYSLAATDCNFFITTWGWIDPRGKDL